MAKDKDNDSERLKKMAKLVLLDTATANDIAASAEQRRRERHEKDAAPPRRERLIESRQREEPLQPPQKWVTDKDCAQLVQTRGTGRECWIAWGNRSDTQSHPAKLRLDLAGDAPLLYIEYTDEGASTNIPQGWKFVALEERRWRQHDPPLQRQAIRLKTGHADGADSDVWLTFAETSKGRDDQNNWYRALGWARRRA